MGSAYLIKPLKFHLNALIRFIRENEIEGQGLEFFYCLISKGTTFAISGENGRIYVDGILNGEDSNRTDQQSFQDESMLNVADLHLKSA